MSRYIVFVINNEEYSIIADACVLKKFPDKIFNVFWNDEKYYVQSKVTMNILQTFIDNMIGKINGLPINPDNMNYYQQLFEEFEIEFNFPSNPNNNKLYQVFVLEYLISNKIENKSLYELYISQNLEFYIDNYPEKLRNVPITSLYNIFNNPRRNLIDHQKCYDFINNSNDSNLFVLFNSIDGNKLSSVSFEESIVKRDEHLGFMPKMNKIKINELDCKSMI